jgi:hypothetical protein
MSKKRLITFDASIRNDLVGIGIYDSTKKKKVHKSFIKPNKNFSALEAERMALVSALQYMQEEGIKDAHLFTDNQNLYNEGINKALIKKYASPNAELFWLPREFNKEADALSKAGSKKVKKELGTNINDLKHSTNFVLKTELKKYSLKRRIALFSRIANTPEQMNFLKSTIKGEVLTRLKNPNDIQFTKFIRGLTNRGEFPNLDKLFMKMNYKITSKGIEKIIRDRNLI